jgi:uncharacterized OB-fold protein
LASGDLTVGSVSNEEQPRRISRPPALTAETAPFWDGLEQGRPVVEQCTECRRWLFPPYGVCRRCGSREVGWVELPPTGTVYSYTVNSHVWQADAPVPYGIALVDFDGGAVPGSVRLIGYVATEHLEALEIGATVALTVTDDGSGPPVPTFVPTAARVTA